MRWFEQTAFSTVMQIGTSANDVAWELGGENGFDQETLDRYRDYTRIHLRLFPYLWSYVTRLAADGRPIARALGLAHPELDEHPDDTYLLGDALLIAPVTDGGVTKRPITFPEGRWVHWFTGEEVVGPTSRDIDAPLGRIPVFISDASLVPMLRPTIDTLAPVAGGSDVDSYATRAGLLYVRGVAGGNGSFELFDGGRVEQISDGATSRLVSHSGSELDEGAIFELLAAEAPASVGDLVAVADLSALEAATSGYLYEAGTLWVKVPAGDGEATITW